MGTKTKIEWCDHTFNPWWGCTAVSAGCGHCYAETFAKRTGHAVWGNAAERRFFGEKHWAEPLAWDLAALKSGRRARVFCSSMADVFEDRPDLVEPRVDLLRMIEATPNLDWLLLTKRPENMNRLVERPWGRSWPRNVWAGTSVENQAAADLRVPQLLQVPAAIRFLSVEPMLGPVNLEVPMPGLQQEGGICNPWYIQMGIDWVIVGGESGPHPRAMNVAWARSVKTQCMNNGVLFFMKQLGGYPKKMDQLEDFPEELRVREWPA